MNPQPRVARRPPSSMLRAISICATLAAASPLAADEFFTLKGHGGPIMGIAVSDADQIATVSFDNAVGLWSGSEPLWLDGHEAAVNAVVIGEDGTLYSAGDDFTLRVWSPQGDALAVWQGHKGKVVSLALSPDQSLIASASWDGTIGLWPVDGSNPRFLEGHGGPVNDVAFAAEGRALYSASADGSIRRWNLAEGQEDQRVIEHHSLEEVSIGDYVLSGGELAAMVVVDACVRLIDSHPSMSMSPGTCSPVDRSTPRKNAVAA